MNGERNFCSMALVNTFCMCQVRYLVAETTFRLFQVQNSTCNCRCRLPYLEPCSTSVNWRHQAI
jgi:hypothetical protein